MKPRDNQRRSATGQQRAYLHSVDQIGDMLRARIRDLVAEWQLEGYVEQDEFVALNPLRADRSMGSFRIVLTGQLQGLVRDFAGGGWDGRGNWSPLQFTADLWFGRNIGEALKWSRGFLGLDGTDHTSLQKTRRAVAQAEQSADLRAAAAEEKAKRFRAYAQRLWLSVEPGIIGTPVDAYLAGRGIDLRAMQFEPGAIRYHPAMVCKELGEQATLPAMITIIQNGKGDSLALHRTFLDVKPDGTVTKASFLREEKKVIGRYKGGYVSIQKGITVDAETGEWKKNPPLSRCRVPVWVDITEGIENALSVAIADQAARVIAAVGLSNMANIDLPPIVEGVTIWRDNDAPGSPADEALQRAIEAFLARGKRVKVIRPPEGVKDVNDLLRGAK